MISSSKSSCRSSRRPSRRPSRRTSCHSSSRHSRHNSSRMRRPPAHKCQILICLHGLIVIKVWCPLIVAWSWGIKIEEKGHVKTTKTSQKKPQEQLQSNGNPTTEPKPRKGTFMKLPRSVIPGITWLPLSAVTRSLKPKRMLEVNNWLRLKKKSQTPNSNLTKTYWKDIKTGCKTWQK